MVRLLTWRSENMSDSEQILKYGSDYEDICAYAYTLITPEKPSENSEFHIQLKVINKKVQILNLLIIGTLKYQRLNQFCVEVIISYKLCIVFTKNNALEVLGNYYGMAKSF